MANVGDDVGDKEDQISREHLRLVINVFHLQYGSKTSQNFENLNLYLYPGWPSVVEMLQDFVFVVAIFVVRVLVQVAAVLLLVLAVVAAVVEFEVVAKNIVLLE